MNSSQSRSSIIDGKINGKWKFLAQIDKINYRIFRSTRFIWNYSNLFFECILRSLVTRHRITQCKNGCHYEQNKLVTVHIHYKHPMKFFVEFIASIFVIFSWSCHEKYFHLLTRFDLNIQFDAVSIEHIEFFNLKMTRSTFSPLTITQRTETFSSSIYFSLAVPWTCGWHESVVHSENKVMWPKWCDVIGCWSNIYRLESHTNHELALYACICSGVRLPSQVRMSLMFLCSVLWQQWMIFKKRIHFNLI